MNAADRQGQLASFQRYSQRLQDVLNTSDLMPVFELASAMLDAWRHRRQVFLCGNGGSAGNAIHLANDFLYGISKVAGQGLRVTALPANTAVMTCLANDLGYEDIFSTQLAVLAQPEDLLIVLSGSGNSPNILKVLEQARTMNVRSFAILGYSGGKALEMADVPVHFRVDDMQISEDLQVIVGHMIMQWMYDRRAEIL